MLLSQVIYGSHAVKVAEDRLTGAVLVIGRDQFTRGELAQIGCYSDRGARNLSELLSTFRVKSVEQLYKQFSPQDLAIPRLGALSLMVLGAAFELKGLGTIESWAEAHRTNGHLVSFTTIKHQIEKEKEAPGRRKRRRRS